MRMRAVAASLLLIAAVAAGSMPAFRPPIVTCNNVDYVFVLNLQRKDCAANPADFQQQMTDFIARLRALTQSGIGVGVVTFSKHVEHRLTVTQNLDMVAGLVQGLLQPPRFDGIATGDALLAAKQLLLLHRQHLAELGAKNRKLVVVAVVAGDRNQGVQRTFAASVQLRKVASHVLAVNLAGGAARKELFRITSDGTRGIFEATTIVDAASKSDQFAQVFCPCPLSWSNYDNCTIRGQVQVQRFFYERTPDLPFNCVLNSSVSFEPCDCPANRVERSVCVSGFIRVSTFVYTRPDNNSDCVESVTSTTQPCGRATGCESFVCPPRSQCITDSTGTIKCVCINPNDVFKVTGCESCGDRAPLTSFGPCINGQRAIMVTTFTKINDTSCLLVNNRSTESCPDCPVNATRQYGPCVRGYQQVIVVFHELKDGRCYQKMRSHQAECRLSSEYQCTGTVMSGGLFVTFDGQLIDFPGPCSYLLTERANQFRVLVQEAIKFPSVPYLTHVQSVVVIQGNVSYEMTNDQLLKVGGVVQPLPYSDVANSVEAFFSDDALVFSTGELYIQVRGAAATVSVRSSDSLRGMLGNCNRNRTDDYTDSSGADLSQRSDRNSALGISFQVTACVTTPCCPVAVPPVCDTNTSLTATALSNCGQLAADQTSPFAHCGTAAMKPLLKSCVTLFCRAQDNPSWQSTLVCATFEAAAFRCFLQQSSYNRSSYPVFRTPSFCPKTCGHNAEFVDNTDFCPRTCARHFFSQQSLGCATPFGYQSRNANGQTPIPGCQCKPGFVLDGSNCVPPNQCECISELCIDRENRTVCESWKAQGYCSKYPLQMRRFCKLTCEQCRVPCQDQINRATCQKVKADGKCSDSFYSQMCQLTCNPTDCECPPCKTVRGPCDTVLKNRVVNRYCYAPDDTGHCQRNLTSTTFEACGTCQTETRSVDTRSCDYCAQQQVTRSTVSVRESTGELRCVLIATNSSTRSAGCECLADSNRTVCYRNAELFSIRTISAPSADCSSCVVTVTENPVRNVTCAKTVQYGECDKLVTKRRKVTVTHGLVRNCQCDYVTEEFEEMCVCPKPHWTPLVCYKNHAMLRWFISFSLVHGQCVAVVKPHKQSVPCHLRRKTRHHCKGCVRVRQQVWFDRHHCRCVRRTKDSQAGRCCCPKPTTTRGHCVGEHRRVTVVRHVLDNHECHAVTRVITERCGCPPSRIIKECDSETGVMKIGKLLFKLVDGTCEEVREVKSVQTKCKPMRVTHRGECRLLKPDAIVKYRRIHYELWERVEGTCRCRHIRRVKMVACGCREPRVQLSKCPAGCPATALSCPDNCRRTRAVVEFRFEESRCEPEERNQEDLPCCCDKPADKPPVCENGRVLATRKFHVQLIKDACHLKEFVVRTDVTRHCDQTDVRRERRGDLVIVKHRAVHECRCVWREERTSCPEHCPEPSRVVQCDGATGEHVVVERSHRLHACRCVPVKRVRRLPVECPEPKVEREAMCNGENPVIVFTHTNFNLDNECQCIKKVTEQRYPCERQGCEQQPTVRLICDENQLFNVVTRYSKDDDGACVPKETRNKVETPRCTGERKHFKKCVKGRMIEFLHWIQSHNCRCQSKTKKRVLGPCTSGCKGKNHGRPRTRLQCDKETNQLVTLKLVWHLREERCVRQWVAVNKRAEPDCPPPRTRRQPCDQRTGKQRIEHHVFQMHECRCRGPKVKVTFRKCSCQGPKVLGRYCDARQGRIVVRMLTHHWNFELSSCQRKLLRKFIPIACPQQNNEKHGPCQGGHMVFQHIRFIRNRQTCRCHKKVESRKVNCHCPVVVRNGKCTHDHHMAVTTILFRKFDVKTRRCVIASQKRRHRRCRCPKRRVKKSCVNGKWEVNTVTYRLVNGECEADRSDEKFGVVCRKPAVVRTTECNKDTCYKENLTFHWEVNPHNCRCRLRLVKKRFCRCCGCPTHQVHKKCIHNNRWRLTMVVHSLRLKTCSKTCRKHVSHRTERVRCPERRRVSWTRCHNCQSRMLVSKYISVNCQCRHRVEKTNRFRACCCKPKTVLRKWCQQSTGFWISQVKKLVLSNHRCVWRTEIKYLPKPVCQLPEIPVVYGICDTTTCLQNVTKIVNVLNKHTCSCQLENVSAGTRPCCCINTNPTSTIICIGDNTLQRTTVTPVFNETSHTCVSITTITTQVVDCGTGDTRSSDPPCIGDTRTIITTRSAAVNCQCQNLTVNTRSEMCQCPPPTNWTKTCDTTSGKWMKSQTVYSLVSGQCIPVTNTKTKTVTCDTTPISMAVCNNDTCVETVTTTVKQLDKTTCSCASSSTIAVRQCCCPTTVQTRSECVSNEVQTVNTRQTLDVTTRTCQLVNSTTRSGEVPCANETRVDLGCDLATRNRTIIVTSRASINCVCQTIGTTVLRQLCACPPDRSYIGRCNLATCLRRITTVHFNLVSLLNGTTQCVRVLTYQFRPCCCTVLGQKRVHVTVQCDKETGNLLVSKSWKKFIVTTEQCREFHKSWVKQVDCTGKFDGEDKLVHRGPCDPQTGLRTVTVKWYTHDTQECRCKLHVKERHKVCSCKHMHGIRKSFCDHDTNEIVHQRKFFVLQDGACVPQEESKRQQMTCPENKQVNEACNECNHIKVISYNVLAHCKCERKEEVERTKCCCPETQFHKKCHKNRMRLTTIRFHLSEDKKSCERVENHRNKRIKCRKRHTIKGKCNKRTCIAQTREVVFIKKRCKCHRKIRVHKRRCCCPKAKSHTRCRDHDTLVHERTVHKLVDGRCVPRVNRKQNRVRCAEPRKIGTTRCDPETGQRHVKFQAFGLHDCRCVPKPMQRVELCACPRPRTVRQPCKGHMRERAVFEIVFKRHEGKCRPIKKLLYKEPCRCPAPKHKKVCDEVGGHTLLFKTLSFRLVSRHGRRTCIHSEHEKPEKIKCGKRTIRRGPCRHGHSKIQLTEHHVQHCRCVRKSRVRRVKCAKRHRRRFRKFCRKGSLILITTVIDPESGEKREQRQVKRVICRNRPRTVPLTKGCIRRGEDGGLYRKVAIIRSFLHECRCKQKRKLSWRLCRCEKTKKSHRCVHDIIEQKFQEEHKPQHGHCKVKRTRQTREHRCPKRPLSLKKSRCDRRSCKSKVLMRKCWMEHCHCKCKKVVGEEVCCTRKPINKRFCKGHRMHFISTRFGMKKRGTRAKDSETGDEWNQIETKPFTRRWSKPIRCPKPEVRQSCNSATGVLTKRVTTFRNVHCKCQPRLRTVHGRCRCPEPRTRTGPCVNGRRQLKHTVFDLGKDERCHKRHTASWKPCACPKPQRSIKCSNGGIHICTVEFKHRNGCRPKRHCRTKQVRCPPLAKKRERCSRSSNKAKLVLIRFSVNRKTCQCDRHTIVRHVYCSCKHLVRKQRSCQGNVWVTVNVNFRLQGGECLPDESVTHKSVECRLPHSEVVPHTCERRSGLSSSGTQIVRTITSVPEKCHCKSVVHTTRVPCICSLIPQFKTVQSIVCSSDDRLVIKVTTFHLVNGKCLPRVQKRTKVVECHGERTRKSACLRDDLGDSFQYILTLHKKPHHCRCQWKVVRKERRNCGCRPPSSRTSCVGDSMLEKAAVRYVHPAVAGASCEPHTSITTEMVNCTEPRTILQPCNTDTCYAKEITVTFQPKHCRCHPFHSYRMLRCCCPPDVVSPEVCNPATNQFEQVTSHYDLVNGTCVLAQNTTYRTVSCDTRSGETNVSVCNTTTNRQTVNVRDVAIANCQCTSTTRSSTQPCACPNAQRVEQGLCNGTQAFTTDNYYRQVFNSTSGTCVEIIYNSVQRPCLCNGQSSTIICVGVNGNILRRITYVEQLVNNTCVNVTIVTDQEITCAGNGTSGQTRSDCDPTTNTRSVNQVNFIVANCTCAAQSTRSGEPCNCFQRNGGRIETSICRADNVTVRTVTYYYDGPGGVCLPKIITTEQRVTCNGIKEVREDCNPDTGKIEIRVFQLVSVACQCVWLAQPMRYEDCICKRSKTKRLCDKGKHLYLTTYYKLVNGQCKKREYKKYAPVVCGKKAGVHYGECSDSSDTRSVVTLEHRVHNCRCVTKRIRKQCPCRCPNSRTWQACKDNQIVTFQLFYNLVNCKCVKKLLTRESQAFCAKRRIERSDCVRGENGDGHLTVVTSHHRSVNCRCEVEKREQLEACECQPLENQQRKCQGRTLTVVLTQRQLVEGACKRVVARTETQSVTCPLQSVRAASACNRRGYRLLERTTWKVRDCRCEPHVRLERQRCSKKCDMAPKVTRSSDCNKATCTKRLYYNYKDDKCQSKHFAITARCCCPHSHQGKRKCLGQAFELSNLFYKLEHGVCIMSAVTYRREIECQRQEGFETATSASGDTIVLKAWHAVKDCTCQKFKSKTHVKHRECKSPEVKSECITVPEPRFVQTVARYVKQTKHGACERLEEVTEKPIVCPLDIIFRGPCTKDDERMAFVRTVKRISFEKVHCRCISHQSVHHEVCRCFQSRVATRCQKEKGVLVVSRWRYEVDPAGSVCHESCDTRTVQVNCDETWRAPLGAQFEEQREEDHEHRHPRYDEGRHSRKRRDLSEVSEHDREQHEENWDGEFSKVLEREVRVGCKCRVQRRKCTCQSRCPPNTKRLVCEDDNKLFRVQTTYHRTSPCRCSYRVRRRPLRIRLPEKKVVHHKCQDCKQRVETIDFEVHACKAKRVTRWHTRRCCCSKKPTFSVHCKAGQIVVRQIRTEHLTDNGHCAPRYRNVFTIVQCRRIISEKALTKCIDGQRVWRRELEKLENCRCKRAFTKITRPCGFKACKSPVVRFGPCINCASKETKSEFIYNPVSNRCEAKKFHKIHNCCCPRPITFKHCVGNRLLLVTKTFKFNSKTGKCLKSEKSKDITRKAYKRCLESKRTTISGCMENGYQVVVTIQPTLVDCVCQKVQSFRFVRCRCDQPQVSEACVQNGTVKYRKTIRQELDGNTCKNITDETYSQIECPVSSTSEGICDSTSCQRVITDVSYTVSDCACMRLTSMRLVTCCCPPVVNETRSCQRADNTLVVTQQFLEFDLQNRACVTRTRSDRTGTVCPQNFRSFAGPCDQFRNNSFYRTVSESITIVSGCECVGQTTTRIELCGCDTAKEYTVCTPENQLLTYRIEYSPDVNNTICLPNRVDLSLRDVVCDGTQRSDVPTCSTGTRSATTGETRITVVTSWSSRSGNCSCATQTRSEQILCACPENSKPKTFCDKWRHEKVNVSLAYNLMVTGSIRQCIPTKVFTRLGPVRCQAPVVQLGKCQFGLMSVKTLVHKLHGCGCIPKVYKHQQRCHKILTPCINKLPDWLCADLDRRFGICHRDFTNATNPDMQQLGQLSALCDRECNRCDGCHSIGGKWQFKYTGRECLVTDVRYPGLFIRKDTGFQSCLKHCKADLACRSFDFYVPSGQCTLAKVDRDRLHDILLPRHHMVGALPVDNRHRGATRCNMYERICSLRVTTVLEEAQLGCPGRHVTASDSHCKCQPVSLALGLYSYCYRTLTVVYYIRSPSGKCEKKPTFVHVPCRPCRDHLPLDKCQAIDALGGCTIGSLARQCAQTCRLCQCDGREFVRTGSCDRQSGKRVDIVIRTEWVPGFRLCQVHVQKVTKQCHPCIVGLKIVPLPCIGKYRDVLYITTTLVHGQCIQTVKRVRMPCRPCRVDVTTHLGPCVHGHRSVNSFFAVSHGKDCKEEKTSYQIGCADCPPPLVRTQPCIGGRRIRQVKFFVRPPGSNQCFEDRFETEDRCGTLCHDQNTGPECTYQQHTGQCDWNLLTRKSCPSTCNRC